MTRVNDGKLTINADDKQLIVKSLWLKLMIKVNDKKLIIKASDKKLMIKSQFL